MIIGNTNLQKITTQKDMDSFVKSLNISSETVLIKPNWVDGRDGTHTDAKVLDMFLTSLRKPSIILESYTFWRTDKMTKGEGDYFSSSEADLENGKRHQNFFKEQDRLFLETTGIANVLKKHNVEYLCITEEVWEGRVAQDTQIKQLVENKFKPVNIEDLYKVVPKRLYDLKGSDLISFSKAKSDSAYGASFSIKNIFGLIPDPTRFVKYHGGDTEELLSQSIVDINKIYQSLFNTIFVVEGVFENCYMDWDAGNSKPYYDWGMIFGGKDGLEVDSLGCNLLNTDFKGALGSLKNLYKGTFGGNDIIDISLLPKNYFQVK